MTSHHQEICEQVLITLRRITRAIDLHSKRLVHHHGLTTPQLIILREIARLKEVSTGQVTKNVSLSNATVTGILDRLSKRGLVQRSRSTLDKRRVLVKLTDLGAAVLQSVPSLLQERFVTEFETLQDWEQTLLLSSLQRIASMMEVEDLDAAPLLLSGEIAETTGNSLAQRRTVENSDSPK